MTVIAEGLPDCPHNVILFIGDGMGFAQIAAAGIYVLHRERVRAQSSIA